MQVVLHIALLRATRCSKLNSLNLADLPNGITRKECLRPGAPWDACLILHSDPSVRPLFSADPRAKASQHVSTDGGPHPFSGTSQPQPGLMPRLSFKEHASLNPASLENSPFLHKPEPHAPTLILFARLKIRTICPFMPSQTGHEIADLPLLVQKHYNSAECRAEAGLPALPTLQEGCAS